MAYIRTMRNPLRARQHQFVPGSLACAASRPFALSASVRRASASPSPAPADAGQAVAALSEAAAPPANPQA